MTEMTQASAIAKQLGGVKPDEEWLRTEIARLNGKSIVPLQQVKTLHDWLDGKRKARKCCRVVGESRTGISSNAATSGSGNAA